MCAHPLNLSSFAGIDARGLPEDLDIHHLIVNSWEDLEAPQNVCIASIPTVFNASLAPPGKAVVHAYTAGNEPYSLWEGLDRRSHEYKTLKASLLLPSLGQNIKAKAPATSQAICELCCMKSTRLQQLQRLYCTFPASDSLSHGKLSKGPAHTLAERLDVPSG